MRQRVFTDSESVESIILSEGGEMSEVLGALLLTAIWEEGNAEVICRGIVDARAGDDFRNLQTNRTFLNA